jgi:3-phenylpropionate/trans-cinnamate dioxygenase ferredoxin reductase subunit
VESSLGSAVTSLDPATRTVTTATGAQLGYDKLLLATGSKPRRLGLPGADLDGLYYLRNVEDCERLMITFGQAKRVVIIGAGWIVLETAAAARAAGLDVTLLVSGDLPLQHVLGPEVAPIFAELHRSHGVHLRYRTAAVELTGRHGAVTGVMLSDGTHIDADMIIVGIGVVPRTELAVAAGLKIDNRIVVDQHLRTSERDIFAAGDIADAYNPRLGRHIHVEHWANARRQGVIAAKAMLGHDAVDVRPSYFFTDQYDLSMEYTGDIGPAGYDRVIFRRYADSRQVIVFWLYEQRIQAGMNINIWDVADDIERLITSARPINADDLADSAIPLTSLFSLPTGSGLPR